jgi:hypothetical protein
LSLPFYPWTLLQSSFPLSISSPKHPCHLSLKPPVLSPDCHRNFTSHTPWLPLFYEEPQHISLPPAPSKPSRLPLHPFTFAKLCSPLLGQQWLRTQAQVPDHLHPLPLLDSVSLCLNLPICKNGNTDSTSCHRRGRDRKCTMPHQHLVLATSTGPEPLFMLYCLSTCPSPPSLPRR